MVEAKRHLVVPLVTAQRKETTGSRFKRAVSSGWGVADASDALMFAWFSGRTSPVDVHFLGV